MRIVASRRLFGNHLKKHCVSIEGVAFSSELCTVETCESLFGNVGVNASSASLVGTEPLPLRRSSFLTLNQKSKESSRWRGDTNKMPLLTPPTQVSISVLIASKLWIFVSINSAEGYIVHPSL